MELADYINKLISFLEKPNIESLKMSLANVHAKGMFSLVIDGTESGKLTRVFIASKKLKPFEVQLHTHRYPLSILNIKGQITQHTAVERSGDIQEAITMNMYNYRSFLNGGEGLTHIGQDSFFLNSFATPIGSMVNFTENQYHTMSVSKGAIWAVEEKGFKNLESKVLGVPFVANELYTEPKQYQINDNCQLVLNALRKLT